MAVTTGNAGAAVETVLAPPSQGVQKTRQRLEKRFLDRRLAVPDEEKVKIPVGLTTRPAWRQQDRLGACPAVGHGIVDCQVQRMHPCRP